MTKIIANRLNPIDSAQLAFDRNLKLPTDRNGRIATITERTRDISYGFMISTYDPVFDEFVQIANKGYRVLEIGAAYGSPYLLKVLESTTPIDYTAVDLIGDQLRILARRVNEQFPAHLDDIKLIEGEFPNSDLIEMLDDEGYDAILITCVLHFLDETRLVNAIQSIYRLLKPGGKLFARMITPYAGVWKRTFVDEMSNKIDKYLNNQDHCRPYPGFVAKVAEYFDVDKVSADYPELLKFEQMFLFNVDLTKIMFETEKFTIEKCEYEASTNEIFKLDGRERLVLVAVKQIV